MQLRQIWNQFTNLFANRLEPKIIEKRDRGGHSYYQIYDPLNQTAGRLNSEAEVRAWLDQRYYPVK